MTVSPIKRQLANHLIVWRNLNLYFEEVLRPVYATFLTRSSFLTISHLLSTKFTFHLYVFKSKIDKGCGFGICSTNGYLKTIINILNHHTQTETCAINETLKKFLSNETHSNITNIWSDIQVSMKGPNDYGFTTKLKIESLTDCKHSKAMHEVSGPSNKNTK